MELLQNADDAGAGELALMLDTTDYPSDSILGPGMAPWQGPALVAFNDAMFTQQDLHNISRIGQDSKLDRPVRTGIQLCVPLHRRPLLCVRRLLGHI